MQGTLGRIHLGAHISEQLQGMNGMQVRAERYMTGDVLTCFWLSEDILTSQRIASCCGDA